MTNMTPATVSEKKLTTAIQAAIGAAEDGILGPASAVDLAVAVGAECWPLTIQLFGQPVIVCKDLYDHVEDGGMAELDLSAGTVTVDGQSFTCTKLPEYMQGILNAGGLIASLNKEED